MSWGLAAVPALSPAPLPALLSQGVCVCVGWLLAGRELELRGAACWGRGGLRGGSSGLSSGLPRVAGLEASGWCLACGRPCSPWLPLAYVHW